MRVSTPHLLSLLFFVTLLAFPTHQVRAASLLVLRAFPQLPSFGNGAFGASDPQSTPPILQGPAQIMPLFKLQNLLLSNHKHVIW